MSHACGSAIDTRPPQTKVILLSPGLTLCATKLGLLEVVVYCCSFLKFGCGAPLQAVMLKFIFLGLEWIELYFESFFMHDGGHSH